ncbi:MAG: hypothetical protein EBX62_09805 [Betaproteobacteria bacterium]|nr:hypothetical protein [Betaproteobacteria bacterium]
MIRAWADFRMKDFSDRQAISPIAWAQIFKESFCLRHVIAALRTKSGFSERTAQGYFQVSAWIAGRKGPKLFASGPWITSAIQTRPALELAASRGGKSSIVGDKGPCPVSKRYAIHEQHKAAAQRLTNTMLHVLDCSVA